MEIFKKYYGVKCFGQLSLGLVEALALVTKDSHDG